MPLFSRILGISKNEVADVQNKSLLVALSGIPADTGDVASFPFVKPLSVNNDGVTFDFETLDGSTNPIDAFTQSESQFDIYITTVNIIIEGESSAALDRFGSLIGGLPEGILTFFENDGVRIPISEIPLRTNIDFLRVGTQSPEFGVDDSAWRIQLSGLGNANKAYNPVWDMIRLSSGYGMRLVAGEDQKMGITIQDDLTGVEIQKFNISISGFKAPTLRTK